MGKVEWNAVGGNLRGEVEAKLELSRRGKKVSCKPLARPSAPGGAWFDLRKYNVQQLLFGDLVLLRLQYLILTLRTCGFCLVLVYSKKK